MNGNAVANLSSAQNAKDVVTAPDGVGGTYVAWADNRTGNYDVFVTRLTSTGDFATGWGGVNGVDISPVIGDQERPRLLLDNSGGLYVCWADRQSGTTNVFAQHLTNSAGLVAGWVLNGIHVVDGTGTTTPTPDLIPDGNGGVIIGWNQGTASNTIRASRLNSDATSVWSAVQVFTGSQSLSPVTLVPDQANGAIFAFNGVQHAYLQRLSSTGTQLWNGSSGVLVTSTSADASPSLVRDGAGGVIAVFTDNVIGTTADVSAARFDATGFNLWYSTVVTGTFGGGGSAVPGPLAVADGLGGVIAAWDDNRVFRGAGLDDAYALHLNSSGATYAGWALNGVQIEPSINGGSLRAATDGGQGAVFAWVEGPLADIFARRVTSGGCLAPVTTISNDPTNQNSPVIGFTAPGAAILAWLDSRPSGTPNTGVFAGQFTFVEPSTPVGAASGTFMQAVIWDGPDDDAVYGAATHFEVRRATFPLNAANWNAGTFAAGSGVTGPPGTLYCHEVFGLQSGTTYYYAMKTSYACGIPPVVGTGSGTTRSTGNVVISCDPGLTFEQEAAGKEVLSFAAPAPNPSNGRVWMTIHVPVEQQGAPLRLSIFDVAGRQVREITAGPASPGAHAFDWDLRASDGRRVHSGAYFARLSVGSQLIKRTIVVQD